MPLARASGGKERRVATYLSFVNDELSFIVADENFDGVAVVRSESVLGLR